VYNGRIQAGYGFIPAAALTEGVHSLKIKAWDAANNSGSAVLDFRVSKKETFILQRVLNYPNPFSSSTNFCFELENGQIGQDVEAFVQVYKYDWSAGKIAEKDNKIHRQTFL
jgi:hypothetical protein